ncbi:hypothetical protein [Streptomyces sp. GZWMJZ-114]|uniref:hypothetical protein n=1 Tax=Streptomyces sp. GZWMJZ-114 TaxID=2494734 RepID=UPI0010108730|nr:hypothetical protein [Streptomyces sp. GZWMJZ-114]
MSNDPDFELYDNTGRDADQITAAKYGTATEGDLRRWAERDARSFLSRHPLPHSLAEPEDTNRFKNALRDASTPAEASAVTQAFLDAATHHVQAISDYLVAAAQWRDQHRNASPTSPPKQFYAAASRALSALSIAHEADTRTLRNHYDPSPRRPDPPVKQPPDSPGTAPRR